MPDRVDTIDGKHTLTISGGQRVRVGSSSVTQVGTHLELTVGGQQTVRVSGDVLQDSQHFHTLRARKVKVLARDELELRCGDASIVLTKNGDIFIQGRDITLKASGKVNVPGNSNVPIRGSKLQGN
jgi:type VI secretion system secreted protein VgrG